MVFRRSGYLLALVSLFEISSAFADTETPQNDMIRQSECGSPVTSVFLRYGESSTGDFDFSSTELSFAHDRMMFGKNDKERNCVDSDWDLSVEGFLSFSESDFSEGQSATLGVGIKRYFFSNTGSLSFFVRGGLSDFEEDGSQLGVFGFDASYSQGYNILDQDNRLILQHFTRGGFVSSNSVRPNDFGQEFEDEFTFVSNAISLDYAFGPATGDNRYLANALRVRGELSVEDKIDSSEFDVNKIYGAEISLRQTREYRDTFRVFGQYRWGSDDFDGFSVGISRQF